MMQVVATGTPLAVTRNARAAAPPADLRIGFLQTIDSLNPYQGLNDPSYLLYGLIYDYPYAFDQDGKWISNIITSSECATPSCTVWNYSVRQGVYWQDPQNPSVHNQLTAADVAFTWNYDSQNLFHLWAYEPYFNQVIQCTPKNAGRCGAVIPANAPWNVTVYFNRPFAAGEDLFGPIVQQAQWSAISPTAAGSSYNNPDPIGTGPFIADASIYTEFQALPNVPLHLYKNPTYHAVGNSTPNVQINNIYLYEFNDVTSLTLAIENGDIDLAQFTTSTIGPLRGQPNIQVQSALQAIQEWNEVGISQCYSNTANNKLNPARYDANVRRALAMATNKDYIVKNIYDGQGVRGDTLISPITPQWWYDPVAGGVNLTFNLANAANVLNADGWTGTWSDSTGTYRMNPNPITVSIQPNAGNYQVENITNVSVTIPSGTHLSFTLAVRPPAEFPEEYTTAQYLQAQWAQIGVKITILQEPTENVLQSDVYGCNVEMYIWYWSSDPDPNYMLSMESSWTLDGWNDNYWVNTSYNQHYLAQLADLNPAQRQADVFDAQKIQYQSASYIIYIFPYGEWAMRTNLWQGWGDWTAHPYRQMNAYWGANPLFFDLNCPTCTGGPPPNQPPTQPVIAGSTPYLRSFTNTTIAFSATSSDAESTDQLNFTWNWHDGTTTVTQTTAANPTSAASHSWPTPGNYTVTVSVDDGWNPPVAGLNPNYVNVTVKPANLGALQGTVKSTSGATIAGAQVTAQPGGYPDTTVANGTYTILLPAGTYNVTATASLFGDSVKPNIVVTAGATTTLDFTLTPNAGWITGTVTNAQSGAALPGAQVKVRDKATGQETAISTDASGKFNISVEPGTFYVNVSLTPTYKPATQNATVTSGVAVVLTFALQPVSSGGQDLTPLILASVGIIAVVAIVAVALIFMRRRKKKEEEESKIQLPPKT